MTDDLRRLDDALLASLDKRLALLEQSSQLEGRTAEARAHAAEKSIDALSAKLDSAIGLWQTVTAEAKASPAGRAIVADLTALRTSVEEHDEFIAQANGALRLARFAIGTSLLAAAGTIVQIYLGLTRAA